MLGTSLRALLPLAMRQAVDAIAFRATGRTLRETGWIPIAQVEDPETSPFPKEEQLTSARMGLLVSNFDAAKYRPAVIRADDGPAHYTGEYADPAGFVTALDFDGITLWAKLTEIVDWSGGRVEQWVSDGYIGRSIGFWYAKTGVPGGFMLRHLALLGGEPEGQMLQGLPPLTRYFKEAFQPLPEFGGDAAAARAEREPFAVRGLFANRSPKEDSSMTDAEMKALLDGFAARTAESTTTALNAALAPVQADLTAVRGELTASRAETATALASATAASAAATAAQEALAAQAVINREAGYRAALEVHKLGFRVAEGEIPSTVKRLMALTPEMATEYLAEIGARQPAVGSVGRSLLTIAGEGGAESFTFEVPPGIAAGDAQIGMRAQREIEKLEGAQKAPATAQQVAAIYNLLGSPADYVQ